MTTSATFAVAYLLVAIAVGIFVFRYAVSDLFRRARPIMLEDACILIGLAIFSGLLWPATLPIVLLTLAGKHLAKSLNAERLKRRASE